jgi:membrane fusion protein, multidrug efflux system
VAPFDGTVVAKHAELGEHLSPGMPIVEIVSRGEVDARIMVPESVVNHIHLGQELPVYIDPLNLQVSGRVVSVTPYGPAASRTFPVRLRLDDQEGNLKVGMSVTVTVDAGPALDALVVSRDAVLVRPDGSTVWVAVEDPLQEVQVHPVPVTVNIQTKGEYAIEPEDARGQQLLRPGARVVIEGAERLMPGQQVRVVTLEEQLSAVAGP